MKYFRRTLLGLVASLLFSVNAQAGLITDYIDFNPNQQVDWLSIFSYTHDINDQGFDLGSAISGDIFINVGNASGDVILFIIEQFDFDTGGVTYGGDFNNEIEVDALAALNADGNLQVTVACTLFCNGFKLKDSTLNVVTASVPEPGALALLTIGLLGLGVARKTRQARS